MTTDRPTGRGWRRRRRHPAAVSRIVAGGLSAATALGLVAVLGADSGAAGAVTSGDPVPTGDPATASPAPPAPPAPVVVIRRHHVPAPAGTAAAAAGAGDTASAAPAPRVAPPVTAAPRRAAPVTTSSSS